METGDSIRKRGYKPKVKKRTPAQQASDRAFCSVLFLKGYSFTAIAERLNKHNKEQGQDYTLSSVQICYDMKKILIEWKREQMDSVDKYVAKELKKLDLMELEVWEAWEKSKDDKRTERRRRIYGDGGDTGVANEITTETTAGDPRFMELLLRIQQRRAALLGFDAPVQLKITGEKDEGRPVYDIKALPQDMLFEVADKLQETEYIHAEEVKANGGKEE